MAKAKQYPVKRNMYNAHHRPAPPSSERKNNTIQGDCLTIQELFARTAQQGHDFMEGTYMDAELDDINSMYRQGLDLTDLEAHGELISSLNDQYQAMKLKSLSEDVKTSESDNKNVSQQDDGLPRTEDESSK